VSALGALWRCARSPREDRATICACRKTQTIVRAHIDRRNVLRSHK